MYITDEFVSEGHFGGGVLSKSESKDGAKSHKDLIEQLIADSKKRKAEKQKEKEQTLDLTEKLDSEWKDLQPVVFKQHKEESIIDKLLNKEDKGLDYDKTMRELRFEKRGTVGSLLVVYKFNTQCILCCLMNYRIFYLPTLNFFFISYKNNLYYGCYSTGKPIVVYNMRILLLLYIYR